MVSKKSKKKINNFLSLLGKSDMVLGKKVWLFSIGNGAEIRPLEMGRISGEHSAILLTCI